MNKNPWDWYIHLHEWLIFMVNVGKIYLPYMDPSWVSLSQQLLEVLDPRKCHDFFEGNFYPWTQTKTAGGLLKRTFHRFTAFPPEKSCSARNSLGSE